ncbi:unnamed protein product [Symbiodinium pilosum]|uniref:Uncharacterized protein n=1 Tax=Symbiodinium pilosum TaxID=2952 RepID=A0A812XCY5_SYMPI|nr:unnamed protein product [Symbiodinium pilosum]
MRRKPAERKRPSSAEVYEVYQAWNLQGGSLEEGVTLTAQALDIPEVDVEEAINLHAPPLPAPSHPPPGLPPGLTRGNSSPFETFSRSGPRELLAPPWIPGSVSFPSTSGKAGGPPEASEQKIGSSFGEALGATGSTSLATDRIIPAIDGLRKAQDEDKTGVYGKELFHAIKRAGHHAKHSLQLIKWPVFITNRLALSIAGLGWAFQGRLARSVLSQRKETKENKRRKCKRLTLLPLLCFASGERETLLAACERGVNFAGGPQLVLPFLYRICNCCGRRQLSGVMQDLPGNIRLGTFAAILLSLVLCPSFFLLWGSGASDKVPGGIWVTICATATGEGSPAGQCQKQAGASCRQ